MSTDAVYHHLTPQVYMKEWKHGNSSVYVVNKDSCDLGSSKSTKKFAGVDNYHTIRAGSLICTEEDCAIFFKPLEKYKVLIDDEVIESKITLNDRFFDYENWTIQNSKGNVISEQEKFELKKKIISIHVKDIESNWNHTFENHWNSIKNSILQELNTSAKSMPAIKRDELIRFMVSLEWRTKPYHPSLLQALNILLCDKGILGVDLKSITIPEEERLFPFLETQYDEFAHSYILGLYRKFLNNEGPISKEAELLINNSTIVLKLAPNDGEFITSDNPVCRFTNTEGHIEYIFPMTPKVLCAVCKGGPKDEFPIVQLTKSQLVKYNNYLKENCNSGYILREQNHTLYFG